MRGYYTNYQRHLLRHRSKPPIANLAAIRTLAINHSIPIMYYIHSTQESSEGHDHDEDGSEGGNGHHNGKILHQDAGEGDSAEKRPHANAITVILGEASSLIHPLLLWRDGIYHNLHHLTEENNSKVNGNERVRGDGKANVNALEMDVQKFLLRMCQETIEIVHKEAQSLASKVGEWFLKDAVDMASAHASDGGRGDPNSHGHDHDPSIQPLDENLDEMAFICQVLHRYIDFSTHHPLHTQSSTTSNTNTDDDTYSEHNVILRQHLAEHILNYTTTETRLISNHIQRAIELAQPVQIIMGTERYVPSVVEDAYYISQRSLERAGSTMNARVICMMANWVVDVWGMEGAVYHALMEQRGCFIVRSGDGDKDLDGEMGKTSSRDNNTAGPKKAPSSLNAFLSAFDKDMVIGGVGLGGGNKASGNSSTGGGSVRNSAPSSGTFNAKNADMHQLQMDTQFCLLNGIHSASSACISLSKLFDTLLPEDDEEEEEEEESDFQRDKIHASTQLEDKSKEASMMILAMEQLQSHSKSYQTLLEGQIAQFLQEWIGTVRATHNPPPFLASLPHSPSLHRVFYHISNQEYNLTAETLQQVEIEDSNLTNLLQPLRESRLMLDLRTGKCDDGVTLCLLQLLSRQISTLFLSTLIHQKKCSEWGALLLSRQVRALREFVCDVLREQMGGGEDGVDGNAHGRGHDGNGTCGTSATCGNSGSNVINTNLIMKEFQKLEQALMILQCSKPSEWIAFQNEVGDTEFDLSKEEIRDVMGLRVDWSKDTIDAVCNK